MRATSKKKQSARGGARQNSGRKKEENPKVGLTIYIRSSEVNLLGGKEKAREIATEYLRTQANIKSVEEMLS